LVIKYIKTFEGVGGQAAKAVVEAVREGQTGLGLGEGGEGEENEEYYFKKGHLNYKKQW